MQEVLLSILEKTSAYFSEKKIESPRLNAELLLCHLLNLTRIQLYLQFDRPISEEELEKFRHLVRERGKRIPLQYLTGKVHFRNLILDVGEGCLIPRPETEILVEKVVQRISNLGNPCHILDFGTGSGCIALSLCKEVNSVFMTGLDSSEKTLEYAKTNALKISMDPLKIKWIPGNNLDVLKDQFDIIVSNPPYIPTSEICKLQPEVQFEPKEALDGGEDGLNFYRMFAKEAQKFLKPQSFLLTEIGDGQEEPVQKIFSQNGNWQNLTFYLDLNGKKRIFEAQIVK